MCRRVNFQIIFALALLLCLVCCTASLADVPKPVGFWRFEGNTADSGSGGNNGTLKGTAAIVADPQRGKCLKLDGDGYLDIASGITELGDASFTITAWIKTTRMGVTVSPTIAFASANHLPRRERNQTPTLSISASR